MDPPVASPASKRAPGITERAGLEREQLAVRTTTSGMFLAAAGLPAALLETTTGSMVQAPLWTQLVAGATTSLCLFAGLMLPAPSSKGRAAATLAILGTLILAVPRLVGKPAEFLLAALLCLVLLALLWTAEAIIGLATALPRPIHQGQAQGAALMALALFALGALPELRRSHVETATLGWAVAVSSWLSAEWAWRHRRQRRATVTSLAVALLLGLLLMLVAWGRWWWVTSCLLLPALVAAISIRRPRYLEMEQASWWEPLLGHPERLLVGTFVGLIAIGTALLALPLSTVEGNSIAFVDAVFTATSAVCVTGLIVLDTPVVFAGFGQAVLMLLIQVGGLGIMTFSTVALWALGRRMSLRHEGAVASLISTQDRGRLFATAGRILSFTFLTEAVGAALLTVAFLQRGDTFAGALWRGVFTSVSAFCNAGFALQSDSLIPYQDSAFILHVIALLIILGGLSPLTVFALPAILTRSPHPVSAQAKLSLASAIVLLLSGFGFFLAFEWSDSLAHLSPLDRIHNAWFQSVTLRTAGFNSVDFSLLRPVTITLMLFWMFIGGNPGSTAGGVKTTTIAILVLSVAQSMRGQWSLEAFGKRITEQTRAKAAVIVAVATSTVIVALIAIQLTQRMPTSLAVFEVVSALGTVGLSLGGTSLLDGIGKAVIIVSMFAGRVGGLTLLMFLSNRRPVPSLGRPEEAVDVG